MSKHQGEDAPQPPTSSPASRAARNTGLWRAEYWIVLGMIIVSYSLCARQTTPNPGAVALLVQLVTVAVILRVSRVIARVLRVATVILAVAATAVAVVWLSGAEGQVLDILLSGASMIAYLIAPIAIIAHQLRRPRIDGQTLLAAISAYILVGMFFTFVFGFVALLTSAPIFGSEETDSLADLLFFSFTTLTTTGYGNLVPVSVAMQSIAIAEAIAGQLFLVIAVDRVVTGFTPLVGTKTMDDGRRDSPGVR